MEERELVIIGAGPAGLAAAVEAKKRGCSDVLVLEREERSGGILNQCIHDGFGLLDFGALLTGPEYAARYREEALDLGVEIRTGAMALAIDGKQVIFASRRRLGTVAAQALILAMGCRERTRGAINLPGSRPAGIWTAGSAQNLVNLKNIMIGRRIVILGSGDIGLIMARRLTLEGGEVLAVLEKMPYPGGLTRNIVQCLEDYQIPLYLSRTVTRIDGVKRLRGLETAAVDGEGKAIPDTERYFDCDTLLLSVGLIPENELSLQAGVGLHSITQGPVVDENFATDRPGIFACGNVLHVHDLVDHVSAEARAAAAAAVAYLGGERREANIPVRAGAGVRYVLPARVSGRRGVTLALRVAAPGEDVSISVLWGEKTVKTVRRIRVTPGEMERIAIEGPLPAECDGLEVVCRG